MAKGLLTQRVLRAQRSEITDYLVYKKLASTIRVEKHKEILEKISSDELSHYEFLKTLTKQDAPPDKLRVFIYVSVSRIFGLNFGLKLMENNEDLGQDTYEDIKAVSPEIEEIIGDERAHESALIDLIDEERLQYISSMVLGLNDALVELTGALVGFSLALQKVKLVGIVGLITGIAASMSMAASEYLSTKHEETGKNPLKASIYTGFAYSLTVLILVLPYFLFGNIFVCLGFVILNALLIIFAFTFYSSVAKGLSFRKRFLEMAGISLGIAALNFCFGLIIRKVFGIEI